MRDSRTGTTVHDACNQWTIHEMSIAIHHIAHRLVDVADQIATRYGVLGREVSHVVLETIALTARDGVNALDDVSRRLGLLSTLDRPSPIDPPGRRWTDLLRSLFPVGNLLVDSWGPPS